MLVRFHRGQYFGMNRQTPSLAVLALICIALAGCENEPVSRQRGAAPPVPVRVAIVESTALTDELEAIGTARANESVVLTAKVSDTVRRVNFDDGDRVAAGAVLVELTDRAEVADLEEAQFALGEAERQYQRGRESMARNALSASQLDQLKSARDQARSRVEALQARLADRVIQAPFAGVLGFRQISTGSLLTPGTVITTLDDTSVIKLDFTVPETLLSYVAAGQSVLASAAAYPGVEFAGQVSSVDSRVDPVTRAATVRALIDNPQGSLLPGMLLSVRVGTRTREALMLPEIAVSARGNQAFVYRVDGAGKVEQVKVATGTRQRGVVEITNGLAIGDRIVTDGLVRMRPGIAVSIQSDPKRGPATATDSAAQP